MNGSRAERPVLNKVLENLRAGDVLVIWKLGWLGRSLPKNHYWIAGEFGFVSYEMKASAISLSDDEAVERVAMMFCLSRNDHLS